MHVMFFGIKRVHLRILGASRGPLLQHELTPARFDMMRIIEAYEHGIEQRSIQYLLGVSPQTVSRMLQSLEQLGFVVRERTARDARCLHVRITDLGFERVSDAMNELIDSGVAEKLALRGFGPERDIARPALKALRRCLTRIRRTYGDTTPFEEPWRGGELPYPATCVDEAA